MSISAVAMVGASVGYRMGNARSDSQPETVEAAKSTPSPSTEQTARQIPDKQRAIELTNPWGSSGLGLDERYDRRLELARVPDAMLHELFEEAVRQSQDEKGLPDRLDQPGAIIDVIAQRDPAAALELVQRHFDGLKLSQAYFTLIHIWGRVDPDGALRFLVDLEDPAGSSNVHNAATGMISEWASRDPRAALLAWLDLPAPKMANADTANYCAECLGISAAKSPGFRDEALDLFLSQEPSASRTSGIGGVLKTWVVEEPFENVTEWYAGHSTNFSEEGANQLAVFIAEAAVNRDGARAANWMLDAVSSDRERAYAMRRVAEMWCWNSPNACADWLTTLEPSTGRDFAIEGFLDKVRYMDPESAFQWTRLLENESRQRKRATQAWIRWLQHAPQSAAAFVPRMTAQERFWLKIEP